MTARHQIARCITHCADRADGRGRWRAERTCAAELARDGDAYIAALCAAAARRIGAHLSHPTARQPEPAGAGAPAAPAAARA